MGFRAQLRDDFPSGWWRSSSWWLQSAGQTLSLLITMCLPVLRLQQVRTAIRCQRSPARLSQISLEAFTAAGLLYGLLAGVLFVQTAASGSASQAGLLVLAGLCWSVLNFVPAAIVVIIIVRSYCRRADREDWLKVAYIEKHGVTGQRPPETIEEYTAQRLCDEMYG